MASQFGSLGYTIMGKTADLTVVQKTIIDTLHKEGKPQTFIAKEAGSSQSVNRKLSGRNKCGSIPLRNLWQFSWLPLIEEKMEDGVNHLPNLLVPPGIYFALSFDVTL